MNKAMYKSLFCLPLLIVAFILVLLPDSASCTVAVDADQVMQVTFAYFDSTYFGYTNFAPLFTAVAATTALVLLAVYCFTRWYWFANAARHILFGGIVFSFMPLLFSYRHLTTVGVLITVTMVAELALIHFLIKEPNTNP